MEGRYAPGSMHACMEFTKGGLCYTCMCDLKGVHVLAGKLKSHFNTLKLIFRKSIELMLKLL